MMTPFLEGWARSRETHVRRAIERRQTPDEWVRSGANPLRAALGVRLVQIGHQLIGDQVPANRSRRRTAA